ncbi:LytR/AlgR family response regulator transcription factor [Sunxiuqinia indica]|uniref:LytR/AlgR family response regulator transcription factor n=1 Tax=Sunxiuqinia indica TaxID=2692584 RepID=UPI00135947AA|nr:LytTR family DNA-binding domain-containing protein [Sunxiuqinia indica]
MKKHSCILVDDEPLSRDLIAEYIADCPELELLNSFGNAIDARNFIQQNPVDLIFLDINMPRLSGIGLIKSLPNPPNIIFITAYAEHAVEGFELEAIDYILKPVEQDRFLKAVNRFLQKAGKEETTDNFIVVKADRKIYRLDLNELLYVEAMGDYIRLTLTTQTLTVYDRLAAFLEKLPSTGFCQIHKSYLVALKHIQYLEGNRIKLADTFLPVSKRFKAELLERLNT